MAHDPLKTLHTSLVDTCEGYRAAAEDAETPALKAMFATLLANHSTQHEAIHQMLVRLGEKPDERGSFMQFVHKGIIAVRSVTTGLKPALDAFAMGERSIAKEYDDAIAESTNASDRATLQQQKHEVEAAASKLEGHAAQTA